MKKKKILYLDMDGPLANFDSGVGRENFEENPPEMFLQGFFRNLKVVPGAREAVTELLKLEDLDIYIGSKHTTSNIHCASEKVGWIIEHFPELEKKMLLICDKTLLKGDYLIDDDLRWKGFDGLFIHFDPKDAENSWQTILTFLRSNHV